MDDFLIRAYQILNIPEDADLDRATRAYHGLLRDGNRGWQETKEIEQAFEVVAARLSPQATVPRTGAPAEGRFPSPGEDGNPRKALKDLLYPPVEEVNPFVFGTRAVFFLAIFLWGMKFIFAPVDGDVLGSSFMHLINLPFHEAGHVLFSILGDFMRVLGGTAMQILVPLICAIAFIAKGDPFAASFALWWTGQSFIDVSPYINDARAGDLMLLGGVTGQEAPDFHDWHNMLARLGLLRYDHALAYFAKYAGALIMLLSLAWAAAILIRQYKGLNRK